MEKPQENNSSISEKYVHTKANANDGIQTEKNILVLYQLPKNNKNNILELNISPSFSDYPNMPLFKYGFYYYIHQTKNKMEIFEKPEFKTKDLHKIVNSFEDIVPQEEFVKQFKSDVVKSSDDINSFSIKYFQVDRIISRAFYKLWELLMMYPLIKDGSSDITTIHIAEAPGSFAQSVMCYRNKFFEKKKIQNDRYIVTSIESSKNTENYIPAFSPDLNNNKHFNIWSYKNSDLTKQEIIDKFIEDHKDKSADLITADGGFNWKDENYQEQEAYILILSEIYCALNTQKIGGCFVIKIFETFTELTVKMIEILKQFYENVIITKPLLSRPSNSERYVICLNYNNKNEQYIKKIYSIIEVFSKNTGKFLVDIFPEYQIDHDLDMIIKLSATRLSNEQHRQINDMITYINEGNYFGELYRKYLMKRREANDFWISTFYPLTTKELNSTRKLINILIGKTLDNVKQTLLNMNNIFISNIFDYNIEINNTNKLISQTKTKNESDLTNEKSNKLVKKSKKK